MTDFEKFCKRYDLDPESADAEAQWIESRRQLERFARAAQRNEPLLREQSPDGPKKGSQGRS